MKRVVIIGGGISGLATAYSLREHQPKDVPLEITLLEKNDRLGGNIVTERSGDFIIEGGPDCFLSEKPWAMELCKRIGLGDGLLTTNETNKKTFVFSRGALRELPEGVILMVPTKILPLAFSSLISIGGKFRMAAEYFIPRKTDDSDETLSSFVIRRLGKEALDKIAEPLVAGVHAADPDTMSVRSSFPKFVSLEQEHGSLIRGMIKRMELLKKTHKPSQESAQKKTTMFITLKNGLSTLTSELQARLTASPYTNIKTNTAVASVAKKNGLYSLALKDGSGMEADSIIICSPAYVAAELLKGFDSELTEKLLTIPYVSTATISLGFKKADIKHPLNGFGFVVPKTEGRKIMAASWTSVKFKYRAPDDSVLIRCFVGGAKDADLVSLSDEEMLKMVRIELKETMGITAEPVITRIYRWFNSMPQYTVGHEGRIKLIEEKLLKHPGLYLTGSAYHGIGIPDSIRTAEITAKKALHHVSA
ncbi:protoporphyrinogen oxidase [bacterium]|nr:MAG: protoporphyrinogen oxidase [bacterium]